jgi:predicted AlkP superfamily phosphohydrolase/phosphomutase
MNRAKTIVIGIDGGCWEYINPLLKNGRLPNIKKLMDEGTYGTLNSTIPPISPVAWSSFVTGQKPYKHGIMDWFMREDDNNFRTANANDRKSVSFWDYLNKEGVKAGVVNIPMTYPAEEIQGFFISGFDSPNDSPLKVYPQKIFDESKTNSKLRSVLNVISLDMSAKGKKFNEFASRYFQYIEAQTEITLNLVEQYNVDVCIINYMICDHFNHYTKDYNDIENCLEKVDACIGKIKETRKEANFIIISDHGSCRYEKIFLMTDWLKSKGFIKLKKDKYQQEMFDSFISAIAWDYKDLKGIWMMDRIFRRAPLAVKKFLLKFSRYYKRTIFFSCDKVIDWKNSKISFYSLLSRAFYFHNEKDSRVLAAELQKLKNPIGSGNLVDRFYFKDEITADIDKHAPHLIAVLDPRIKCNTNLLSINSLHNFTDIQSFSGHHGGHTAEGIYIFSGCCFKNIGFSSNLNIYDIPALILYLNKISIPDVFDGIVPLFMLQENFISDNPLSYQKSLPKEKNAKFLSIAPETEEEIKQHLINLGYL